MSATEPAPPSRARPSLIGLDLEGLVRAATGAGAPEAQAPMRARQLRHWLYRRGVTTFEAMRNLPEPLRRGLADRFTIVRPETVARQESADGTIKWLLRFADGNEVESVFIPESDRGALCVSTQVGCSLTCTFCHTGTMPLVRNLGPGEILAQVLVARDVLGDWPTPAGGRRLTNVVVMGMGEPLLNYDNLVRALGIAIDSDGIDLSKRRITVSTSGVVPRMRSLGEALGVGLAVSLHAVRDELRDELVPINRKWPIAALLDACRSYPGRGRLITFEYVMLRGVNDSDADAHELVRLLRGLPAKINLIPFNPWPGAPFACSTRARIASFAGIVDAAGFAAPVRRPRGRDILAACGQLKTASQRLRRRAAA